MIRIKKTIRSVNWVSILIEVVKQHRSTNQGTDNWINNILSYAAIVWSQSLAARWRSVINSSLLNGLTCLIWRSWWYWSSIRIWCWIRLSSSWIHCCRLWRCSCSSLWSGFRLIRLSTSWVGTRFILLICTCSTALERWCVNWKLTLSWSKTSVNYLPREKCLNIL